MSVSRTTGACAMAHHLRNSRAALVPGPPTNLKTIEKMVAWTTKPLSAIPNAGPPATVEGRNIYLCSPEYMAQYARRFLQAGVRMIGGCCGTTPEHIKTIVSEVRSLQPVQHRTP